MFEEESKGMMIGWLYLGEEEADKNFLDICKSGDYVLEYGPLFWFWGGCYHKVKQENTRRPTLLVG